MLELFKKNHWFYSLLLLPYGIILRINALWFPKKYTLSYNSITFENAFGWIYGHAILETMLAILLLFLQAVMINRLIINNRMSRTATLVPGLFYITLCSLSTPLLRLSPALIAMTFVILALGELYKIYIRKPFPKTLFNYGLWAAIAWLIYPPLFILTPLGIIAMQVLRGIKFKELLQMLGGVFTGMFLVGTYFFYTDDLIEFVKSLMVFHPKYYYHLLIFNWIDKIYYAFLMLLLLITLGISPKVYINIGIKERKKWQIVVFFLIASFLAIILQPINAWQHWTLIFLPVSMILGVVVGQMKQSIILDVLMLLIAVSIVFLHFQIEVI